MFDDHFCYCINRKDVNENVVGFLAFVHPDEPDMFLIELVTHDAEYQRREGTRIHDFEQTGGKGEFKCFDDDYIEECDVVSV